MIGTITLKVNQRNR